MNDIYYGPLALLAIYSLVFIGLLIDYINRTRRHT